MSTNSVTRISTTSTAQQILTAARQALLDTGFATLSTRKVAEAADVPLSQIHYHFGSKEQMILAMLAAQNDSLVRRQAEMFTLEVPLSVRWDLACDYLDDDLESGYVRVLQEMMAAGWSSPDVRAAVGDVLGGWFQVLTDVVNAAGAAGTDLGPFDSRELVALVAAAFFGTESMVLLGLDGDRLPLRSALRRVGDVLRIAEHGR